MMIVQLPPHTGKKMWSVFAKIVTRVFGKKSDRDMKILTPFIAEINSSFNILESLSDDELKQRFQNIRDTFQEESMSVRKIFKSEGLEEKDLEEAILKSEQKFLDEKMVEVYAIVKDSCIAPLLEKCSIILFNLLKPITLPSSPTT